MDPSREQLIAKKLDQFRADVDEAFTKALDKFCSQCEAELGMGKASALFGGLLAGRKVLAFTDGMAAAGIDSISKKVSSVPEKIQDDLKSAIKRSFEQGYGHARKEVSEANGDES